MGNGFLGLRTDDKLSSKVPSTEFFYRYKSVLQCTVLYLFWTVEMSLFSTVFFSEELLMKFIMLQSHWSRMDCVFMQNEQFSVINKSFEFRKRANNFFHGTVQHVQCTRSVQWPVSMWLTGGSVTFWKILAGAFDIPRGCLTVQKIKAWNVIKNHLHCALCCSVVCFGAGSTQLWASMQSAFPHRTG